MALLPQLRSGYEGGTLMYDELIKRLRDCTAEQNGEKTLWHQAADAIEELRQIASHYEEESKGGWLAACDCKEERERLREAMPRWIPVTERLPEKRKWVLCRCEANIVEVLRWENNEWYHDPMHVYYPSFVTHWMPLPEPPKEET